MSAGFLEAFYGAGFALIGWLVLSIMRLTLAIRALEQSVKPLTQEIPKLKSDVHALHKWRRDLTKANGKNEDK